MSETDISPFVGATGRELVTLKAKRREKDLVISRWQQGGIKDS